MLPLLHTYSEVSLTSWYFDPPVISGTFIVVSFYFYGVFSQKCFVPWRAALFVLGVASMVFALVSPIDAAADRLLSMHMLQHVFLTTIGPPLVLLGLPVALFEPAILKTWLALKYVRLSLSPVVVATLFVVNMWLWHVPPVYEAALTSEQVHNFMHFAFLATGMLYWWPVIQPAQEEGRIGDGGRLLYLFATGMPMMLLAVMFFASGTVIYDFYDRTDRLWNISPMDDQQVAGLIMGALGEAASFVAITWLFARFLDREEEAALAAAPARHPADVGPTT